MKFCASIAIVYLNITKLEKETCFSEFIYLYLFISVLIFFWPRNYFINVTFNLTKKVFSALN